ncbi:MAG: hypothetical protein JW751_22045 [Polyangiaceae bacterium]|nr:hypothetical protein [Polyangiaceae bacterium]
MNNEQWAVVVVVNHTRQEILADAATIDLELPEGLANPAVGTSWLDERAIAVRARVQHWDLSEDRLKPLTTIPVGDEEAAHRLVRDLRRHAAVLASHCPRAKQLVEDGYLVLGLSGQQSAVSSPAERGSTDRRPADR